QAVLDDLSAAGMEIAGDRLKTRPRGTPPDHPRLELLRHRSLYAHEGWPADPWMADPDAVVTRVRESWRRLRPLVDWGRRRIGPPASPGYPFWPWSQAPVPSSRHERPAGNGTGRPYPLGYGVIGSTSDSGSLSLGSSPGTPAASTSVNTRPRRLVA